MVRGIEQRVQGLGIVGLGKSGIVEMRKRNFFLMW
jgi:hypothetical protein